MKLTSSLAEDPDGTRDQQPRSWRMCPARRCRSRAGISVLARGLGSEPRGSPSIAGVPYCTMVAVVFEAPFHKAPLQLEQAPSQPCASGSDDRNVAIVLALRSHPGVPGSGCARAGATIQFPLLRSGGRADQCRRESTLSGSDRLCVGRNRKRSVPL
jgi:hypothetical protein